MIKLLLLILASTITAQHCDDQAWCKEQQEIFKEALQQLQQLQLDQELAQKQLLHAHQQQLEQIQTELLHFNSALENFLLKSK